MQKKDLIENVIEKELNVKEEELMKKSNRMCRRKVIT